MLTAEEALKITKDNLFKNEDNIKYAIRMIEDEAKKGNTFFMWVSWIDLTNEDISKLQMLGYNVEYVGDKKFKIKWDLPQKPHIINPL